jgi:SAM-dependent methyltransferase/uncharacterized protein YbaR (Trm112 family)
MSRLYSILACPICHDNLEISQNSANCVYCGIRFNFKGRVLSFICREMYESDLDFQDAQKIIEFWGKGWAKRLKEPDHEYIFQLDPKDFEGFISDSVQFHQDNRFLITQELDLDSIKYNVALNIGPGAGGESLIFSHFGSHCIGMDITNEAACAADYLLKKHNKSGFGIQADARFVPIKTASVDFVYSSGVLHHSPDILRSANEIWRVLKPGRTAYIMLYSTYSIMFLAMRIKGILLGHISKVKQKTYMSCSGEGEWRTGVLKNPHTDTFTMRQCANLFKRFKELNIRKGSFSIGHLPGITRFISPERLDRLSRKYVHFLEPYLGTCLFIKAKK